MSHITLCLCFLLFHFLYSSTQQKKIVRTVSGIPQFGGDGKLAKNAFLYYPSSTFVTPENEMYIADTRNVVIRKVNRNGIISTVVGTPNQKGFSKTSSAKQAKLSTPVSVFVSPEKEIYLADKGNHAIQKVLLNGTLVTIAGGNGPGTNGDGDFATNAQLNQPTCVVLNSQQEVLICDFGNAAVRKILVNGTIITIAGVLGVQGNEGDGQLASQAKFNAVNHIVLSSNQEMYLAVQFYIKKVFQNGTIITIAGRGVDANCYTPTIIGNTPATSAQLCFPSQIAEWNNELYFTDKGCQIFKISANGTIFTFTDNSCGYSGDNGHISSARLDHPSGLVFNSFGELLITDQWNNVIRKVDTNGIITTVVGFNPSSDIIDTIKHKKLFLPRALFVHSKDNMLYVSDTGNTVLKRIDITTGDALIIAGQLRIPTFDDGSIPDGSIATEITLSSEVTGLVVHEETGHIYYTEIVSYDTYSYGYLRRITPKGRVYTLFSNLNSPQGLFISKNDLFFGEQTILRRLFLHNSTLITMAGMNGQYGCSGDLLSSPISVQITYQNELYILDSSCRNIRKVFANGTMIVYASLVGNPVHMAIAPDTNQLFIGDATKRQIYQVLHNGSTIIEAGTGSNSFVADNNDPLQTDLANLGGMFYSGTSLFYSDLDLNLIRQINFLCTEYSFSSSLQILHKQQQATEVSLQSQLIRSCNENSNYFNEEYLPLVEVRYKATGVEYKTFVTDWSQYYSMSMPITNRQLDIITVTVIGCDPAVENLFTNCSITKEYAIAPTSISTNFFFIADVTSVLFIHQFRLSPFISVFEISLEFVNTKTNQTELIQKVTSRDTVPISGLKHSTIYSVYIYTFVEYVNGISFNSTTINQQISTKIGELPSTNVQDLSLVVALNSILLLWSSTPFNERPNSPINRIEIEVSTNPSQQDYSLLTIAYNADTNTPSSYSLTISDTNKVYSIRVRLCNQVGCGNFSTPVSTFLGQTVNTSITNTPYLLAIIVPAIVVVLFVILVIILLLIFIIFFVAILLRKRRKMNKAATTNDQELMDHIISKQFRIDEFKIDLKQSQFLGNGISGSVITAKYFNIEVAIKIIQTSKSGVETDLTDFYNECKFLHTNAQHANIIRFFGVYENKLKNHIGLVMELCSNGTVANYVTKHSQMTFEMVVKLIQGIANGMQYLHFHNIAHRDLKCENILLDDHLTPKIIDFGYSKMICEEANKSMQLTMNIGTAVYCAPEVVKLQLNSTDHLHRNSQSLNSSVNQNVSNSSTNSSTKFAYDKKCDVYSFAICMWVIYFKNKNPYGEHTNNNQILYQIATNPNFRPKIEEKNIPISEKWFIDLMQECWRTIPEERPSFEQICSILQTHQK